MPMPAPDWNNFYAQLRNFRGGEGGAPVGPQPKIAPPPAPGQPPAQQPPGPPAQQPAGNGAYNNGYVPQYKGGQQGATPMGQPPANQTGPGAQTGQQGGPPAGNQTGQQGGGGGNTTNQLFGGYTAAQLQADPSLVSRLGSAARQRWNAYSSSNTGAGSQNGAGAGNQTGGGNQTFGGYTVDQLTKDPSLINKLGPHAKSEWDKYQKGHQPPPNPNPNPNPNQPDPNQPNGPNGGNVPGTGGAPAQAGQYDHQPSADGQWTWDSLSHTWVPSFNR